MLLCPGNSRHGVARATACKPLWTIINRGVASKVKPACGGRVPMPSLALPGRLVRHARLSGKAVYCAAVTLRVVRASALVIVLSLFSAPAVGIACGLWCERGHHGGSAVAHHDMGHGAPATGVSAAHSCNHLFDTVQLFAPKTDSTVQGFELRHVVAASRPASRELPLSMSRLTRLCPLGVSDLPPPVPILVLRI